ncbi:MAG: iron transporter [Betaproteobacteria bacterium]|nr:iron transporter [Betaproteobacteria bacterium]
MAICSVAIFFVTSGTVLALEYPIGKPQRQAGMEVSVVYLQPVSMDPEGMMRAADQSDIHLEADIHAIAGNPQGFEEGAWMPYLVIGYELTKAGSTAKVSGELMPMTASDGPHYGDNVKLLGPGKYHLRLFIKPPSMNPLAHFGRHTDRLTGVPAWWKPFEVDYDFVFVGLGKKGGY